MIGKSRIASLAAAAAITGLVGGAGALITGCHHDDAGNGSASSTHASCKAGMNDCKGKGNCKTADHGCKGLNDCKGKGGCAPKS